MCFNQDPDALASRDLEFLRRSNVSDASICRDTGGEEDPYGYHDDMTQDRRATTEKDLGNDSHVVRIDKRNTGVDGFSFGLDDDGDIRFITRILKHPPVK